MPPAATADAEPLRGDLAILEKSIGQAQAEHDAILKRLEALKNRREKLRAEISDRHNDTESTADYDALCTYVRRMAEADAAMVVVLGGKSGSGFSVQALGDDNAHEVVMRLPEILESIAMQIRAEWSAWRDK